MDKDQQRQRMTRSVRDAILAASLQEPPKGTRHCDRRLCRWMPWLLSFTGARPLEILTAKREHFLEVASIEGQDSACIRLPQDRRPRLKVPLHPRFIEDGLLEMAQQHIGSYPFLYQHDDLEHAAYLAHRRYVRRLSIACERGGFDRPALLEFRRHFIDALQVKGVDGRIRDCLLRRRVDLTKFADESAVSTGAVKAIASLEWPAAV